MAQMLMVNVNIFQSLDHFEIDETEVFVDTTQYTFNFANLSRRLSGFQRQQTL